MKRFFLILLLILILPQGASATNPIRVLIVPGHDNEVWGAEYGNMKEADMTLSLGTKIFNLLKKDDRFQVYITRDQNGFTKEFGDYFINHQAEIVAWKQAAKSKFQAKIAAGAFVKKTGVLHNKVSQEVSVDLYGINKWVDENNIDLVLHVHFNDYPRPNKWTIGKYRGFTVYMPDKQMLNSAESDKLAKSIFQQMRSKYLPSTYPKELGGLVPEQNLIALGSSDTLLPSVRSILIEYGYIYEKKFRNSSTRLEYYKNAANLTVAGITNYFFPKS